MPWTFSKLGTTSSSHTKSFRLRIDPGRKRWMQRTPAMAEGLTDHIGTIGELMAFRIPIQ
jgi:hypothetical protein